MRPHAGITPIKEDIGMKNNSSQQPPLVLIADGNEDNLYLTTTVVQDLGCRSISVNNGTAALQAYKRYSPDLVLLETVFPDKNGSEVMAGVRRSRHRSHVSAIAVTSAAMPGDRAHALSMGFDSYLAKPYSIVTLEQLIYQYIYCKAQHSDFCRALSARFQHLAQEARKQSSCNRR